jgi:hypothetical protein
VQQGWYRGLMLGYLDGGQVPVDAQGQLVAMDGVLLSPAGATSRPSDPKAVLLPFLPGEAGYSPIVRLRPFTLPAGKSLGAFTGLCRAGAECAASELDESQVTSPASLTLFIVASAP